MNTAEKMLIDDQIDTLDRAARNLARMGRMIKEHTPEGSPDENPLAAIAESHRIISNALHDLRITL